MQPRERRPQVSEERKVRHAAALEEPLEPVEGGVLAHVGHAREPASQLRRRPQQLPARKREAAARRRQLRLLPHPQRHAGRHKLIPPLARRRRIHKQSCQ